MFGIVRMKRRVMALMFAVIAASMLLVSCGGGGGGSDAPVEPSAPDVPVISGIASGSFNTDQSFTIAGKSGATIEYTIDGGTTWNAYTAQVTLSSEDTYLVAARQTADGKTSANTVTIQVIIDKTLPDAPAITGITAGYFNTNQTFSVTGTESSVEYSTNGGSTWTAYAVPVTLSAENTYTVTARQTDTAGNVSSTATPVVLTVDKTVVVPVIGGVVAGSYNEEQDITITGEDGATIEYSTNGGTNWSTYPTGGVTLSSEGDYTITARQTDRAGNPSGNAASVHVIIDTTLPSAPSITGISSGTFNADQAFTVSGEANATIQYTIDGGTNWLAYAGEVTLHDDGAYTVVAKQSDLAGNPSEVSTSYSVTIDQTDPANVTGLAAAASNQKITLSWTEPAGDTTFSKVRITFTPVAGGVSQPIEVLKGTTTAQITPLVNGTEYTFTVVSIDTAENESSGAAVNGIPVMPKCPVPVVEAFPSGQPVIKTSSNTAYIHLTGYKIKYTKDGTDPKTSPSAIEVQDSTTCSNTVTTTIRAYAFKDGMSDSDTVQTTFSVVNDLGYILQDTQTGDMDGVAVFWDGYPRAVYYNTSEGSYERVKKWNGTSWDAAVAAVEWRGISFTVDADDNIYYLYDWNDALVDVRKNNNTTQLVDRFNYPLNSGTPYTCAITTGTDSLPIVVWDQTDGVYVAKYESGTTWVDLGSPVAGRSLSQGIAVDPSDNKPVVVVTPSGNSRKAQVFKWDTGTQWTDLGVVSAGTADWVNIQVDSSDNRPVVAYISGYHIYVKKYSGTEWTELDTASLSSYSSIINAAFALDANNKPILAFNTGGYLQVMKMDNGSTWSNYGQWPTSLGDSWSTVFMDISPNNLPVIAFKISAGSYRSYKVIQFK